MSKDKDGEPENIGDEKIFFVADILYENIDMRMPTAANLLLGYMITNYRSGRTRITHANKFFAQRYKYKSPSTILRAKQWLSDRGVITLRGEYVPFKSKTSDKYTTRFVQTMELNVDKLMEYDIDPDNPEWYLRIVDKNQHHTITRNDRETHGMIGEHTETQGNTRNDRETHNITININDNKNLLNRIRNNNKLDGGYRTKNNYDKIQDMIQEIKKKNPDATYSRELDIDEEQEAEIWLSNKFNGPPENEFINETNPLFSDEDEDYGL